MKPDLILGGPAPQHPLDSLTQIEFDANVQYENSVIIFLLRM